ncbi:thioredoxin domain-containing protein [Desulforhabdus amnigena]|jgi:protein-disulfide isomerase|nr:thioredoxin domain-containing protein [Desulforhabdus amnigena]NLJ29972.1 thioredoxin domain-containing protein [Deltaproteobacteria bacterium]
MPSINVYKTEFNGHSFFEYFLRRLHKWRSRRLYKLMTLAAFSILFSFSSQMTQAATSSPRQSKNAVASVNGQIITSEQIEKPLASQLYRMQQEIYNLKRTQLEQTIAQILLQKEADKKGISLDQFVKEVILPQGVQVSDEEVEKYYTQNQESLKEWKGTQEELKQQIKTSLEEQKYYQKINEYIQTLISRNKVEIYLQDPPLPSVNITAGNSPSSGPSNAPLTIIELSDYQCPSCRQTYGVTKRIMETFKGRIRWVFKDFPLGQNPVSVKAAEASRCAADQSKFWEYHDLLFGTTQELTTDKLKDLAKQLNLDMDKFSACLDSGQYRNNVLQEAQEFAAQGVDRTPSFVINGKLLPGGPSFERFKDLIDRELSRHK